MSYIHHFVPVWMKSIAIACRRLYRPILTMHRQHKLFAAMKIEPMGHASCFKIWTISHQIYLIEAYHCTKNLQCNQRRQASHRRIETHISL